MNLDETKQLMCTFSAYYTCLSKATNAGALRLASQLQRARTESGFRSPNPELTHICTQSFFPSATLLWNSVPVDAPSRGHGVRLQIPQSRPDTHQSTLSSHRQPDSRTRCRWMPHQLHPYHHSDLLWRGRQMAASPDHHHDQWLFTQRVLNSHHLNNFWCRDDHTPNLALSSIV